MNLVSGYKQNQSIADPGNVSTYLHVLQSFFPNSNDDGNNNNDEDNINNNYLRRNAFEEIEEENLTSKKNDAETIETTTEYQKSILIETTENSNQFLNINKDSSIVNINLNPETEPSLMSFTTILPTNAKFLTDNQFLEHSEDEEPLMNNITSLMVDDNMTNETTTTTITNVEISNVNKQMDNSNNKIESEIVEKENKKKFNLIPTTIDSFQFVEDRLSTESTAMGQKWLKDNLQPTTIAINTNNEFNIARNMLDDDLTTNVVNIAKLTTDTTMFPELTTNADIKIDDKLPEMSTTAATYMTTISPETLSTTEKITKDWIKNELNEQETSLLLPTDIQARIMSMNGIDDDENSFKRNFHNAYYSNSAIFDDLMKRYSLEFRQHKAFKLFDPYNDQLSITDNEIDEINHFFFDKQFPSSTVHANNNLSKEILLQK